MNWTDIQIKIVGYKLELLKVAIHDNRADYAYEKRPLEHGLLNIIYNCNFYCSKEVSEKIMIEINTYTSQLITSRVVREMEARLEGFIRRLYMDGHVFIEGQKPVEEGMAVFQKEECFRLYDSRL